MTVKCLSLMSTALLLAACSGTAEIADPSAAQAQAADQAFADLRDGKYEVFLNHLEPKLQAHFQDNPKILKKFSASIPKQAYLDKKIMTKNLEQDNGQSQYKISYELKYPKNLVQYDVSFDAPNGSAKISNFNIQVFGASTK